MYIVNEDHLHDLIIRTLDRTPTEMRSGKVSAQFMAWVREFKIPNLITQGQSKHSADIVAVDELGRTWIIEAKRIHSVELNQHVWDQVVLYRDEIKAMTFAEIQHTLETNHLPQVTEISPSLIDHVTKCLHDGNVGLAVIADDYSPTVVEGAKMLVHNGPVAYLPVIPVGDGLRYWLGYYRGSQNDESVENPIVCEEFVHYRKREKAKLNSIREFRNKLSPDVQVLFDDIVLPALLELGCDITEDKPTKKDRNERNGITLSIRCRGEMIRLVRIARPDSGARNVPAKNKTPGTYGLRVDLHIHNLRNSQCVKQNEVEELLAKPLYRLGWRGTGGCAIGLKPIKSDQYQKVSAMKYYPKPEIQDFTGRPGEAEDLQGFFKVINGFCNIERLGQERKCNIQQNVEKGKP